MSAERSALRLSRDEETFLRHWMYAETHYQGGSGPAKQLQLERQAVPADLAAIIAAAIPDLAEQEAAGVGPPPAELPTWPWSGAALEARVAEARSSLATRDHRLRRQRQTRQASGS